MTFSPPSSRLKNTFVWRILLVDDDEDDYILVRQMLSVSREGKFTLEWASSFALGQQTLEYNPPYDAVIVDYDMGCHTGIELIREAVAREYPAPILLLTGRGTYEIDVEAMEAGAADYLSKGEMNPVFLERAIRYAIERKKNEVALRASENELKDSKQRYQELFSTMLNGIAVHEMIYDDEGAPIDYRFLEINPAFEQLTGLKATDIIGKTVREVLPGIDQVWIEMYGKVARTGEAVQFENFATPLGRYYEVYAYCPHQDQFATVFLDITERVQSERKIRESEQRFRALFENRHSVMWLIDPVNARIVDVNPAGCAFYGWSREEMVGMPVANINTLPPEELQRKFNEAQSTTTSLGFHFQHRLANGEIRDVDVRTGPITIGDQRLLFSIINDITEHVKVQQALQRHALELRTSDANLREANEHLRIALQAAKLGIWSVDLQTKQFYFDDAARRILGFAQGETISVCDFAKQYLHPEDMADNQLAFDKLYQTGVYEARFRVVLPTGEVRPIYSYGGLDADQIHLYGVLMASGD